MSGSDLISKLVSMADYITDPTRKVPSRAASAGYVGRRKSPVANFVPDAQGVEETVQFILSDANGRRFHHA